jgi:hypothetical protein
MTATNHGLVGSTIAITLHNYPVLAITIAVISHFLLDSIPHFGDDNMDLKGSKFKKILSLDAIIAVISTLILALVWQQYFFLVIFCAFAAASPDLMWIYYVYINPKLRLVHKIPRFHTWIQWSQTPKGAYIEVMWFLGLFSGLIYFGVQ